jgi:hypothetical protein
MASKPRKIVNVDAEHLSSVLRRVEESLGEDDFALTQAIFESYAYLSELVEDKNTTIDRLRKLLFGATSEKSDQVLGETEPTELPTDSEAPDGSDDDSLADEPPAKSGHGRNGADAYEGGQQIEVAHQTLQPGDHCPDCQHGMLYQKAPRVLVRVSGQAPLEARVYRMQRLRCHLCGKVFTANPPANIGQRKYDATAASMIALLKYGTGLPFNRLAGLQRNLRIPLPASTQWDVIEAFASSVTPAYEELLRQAAAGEVLHNDDTTAKILELMGKRRKKPSQSNVATRTGIFTSGVVAVREGCKVALFFSGRQHAGENLSDVLKHRSEALTRPIQMCDALSRNLSGELKTIVANCLVHARRKFVEIYDRFPDQCRYVVTAFKVVYRNDATAIQSRLSPQERLQFHQQKSQVVMDELHNWLECQLSEKRVEPNSALGDAITYMLNHWEKLTLFLRQAGAPLDNNLCERALKKAILHRKNALFFKTQNGARIGDLYMSVIHTCELSGVSAFDYLVALCRHRDAVTANPQQWLPWNYQRAMDAAA